MLDAKENKFCYIKNAHLILYIFFNFQAELTCRFIGAENIPPIKTRGHYVTLKFVADEWGIDSHRFTMVITAYKDASKFSSHTCPLFHSEIIWNAIKQSFCFFGRPLLVFLRCTHFTLSHSRTQKNMIEKKRLRRNCFFSSLLFKCTQFVRYFLSCFS